MTENMSNRQNDRAQGTSDESQSLEDETDEEAQGRELCAMSDSHKLMEGSELSDSLTEAYHKKLSDVALFSLAGLCSVSLMQLFSDQWHRDFKKTALQKLLDYLGQPKQTHSSIFAMMTEEGLDNSATFLDIILREQCLQETREPLIADIISLAISDGCYDARMRMLIKHVAWQLRVTWDQMEDIESCLAETLEHNAYVMTEEEAKEKKKKQRNRKVKRYALIGLATIGGGALIGLTGGLAAPLVAAGAGAIIGGAGAAALGSAAGVAIIGSLFGVAGAGLTEKGCLVEGTKRRANSIAPDEMAPSGAISSGAMLFANTSYKMKRRIGAIEEFSFEPLTLIGSRLRRDHTVKQLHITIAVTGWLTDQVQDFRLPWSCLAESKEQYSLRWESKYLKQLGEALDYIVQAGISVATTEALKYTVLSGLLTAIAWPAALIAAAGAIDNPWHVCTQRATETGRQLAEVLLAREQGNRPVTLIGFSLGARVIFSCLEELAKRKGSEGLVEDVILLGTPVSGDPKQWQPLGRVVAGKVVNGYSRGDWLLKFLYRTASVQFRIAGLGPVKWVDRRMHNIDLSDIIDGHGDYLKNLDMIMKAVGVRTKDELKPKLLRRSTSSPRPGSVSGSCTNISESGASSSSANKLDDVETLSDIDSERELSESDGNTGVKPSTRPKVKIEKCDSLIIPDRQSCKPGKDCSADEVSVGSDERVTREKSVKHSSDNESEPCAAKSKGDNSVKRPEKQSDESDVPFRRVQGVEEEMAQRLVSVGTVNGQGLWAECDFTDSDPDIDSDAG